METKNKLKKQATGAGGWIKSWTMCGTGKPPISTTSHQASPSAVQTDRNSQSATQPATQPSQSMTTSNVGQRQDEGSNPRWREENKNHLEKRSKLNKRQKKNWDRSEKRGSSGTGAGALLCFLPTVLRWVTASGLLAQQPSIKIYHIQKKGIKCAHINTHQMVNSKRARLSTLSPRAHFPGAGMTCPDSDWKKFAFFFYLVSV